uniref:DNA-directed RNA polymerase n=1 Tax=Florenciella sp. virus SA2 TaxID=3240092 RepID=A0AB39JBY2_9VIRU
MKKHPYGSNVIVAIMCYNGYNVEDAILFNEGSVKRGLFHTTYYSMYEAYEESSSIGDKEINNVFTNINEQDNIKVKPGYDYSHLNEYGVIDENVEMNDKNVVIGMMSYNENDTTLKDDTSVVPKKGQLGVVDKTYITQDVEGKRIAKVRIREQRIPSIGDKFCSRCGQKGTVGYIIPEENMPFTKNGIRPDIIINPHAIPSRMTIGQLIECIKAKLGLDLGVFMDSTPFTTDFSKIAQIENSLMEKGIHKSGNEYLYNGMTGEMIEHSIFIGPTYYMRLKHMVKDKINYRSKGPRNVLTRQTNHGRANDGGLRIGEMERDGIIGHGCSYFLKESLMTRGDKYKMAICNNSGTIAIYDKPKNQFFSPIIDGPIKYNLEDKEDLNGVKMSRFGKNFSIVEIPYSFKLLLQELSAMNIQMRLITNENVNEIELGNNINSTTQTDIEQEQEEEIMNVDIKTKDEEISTNTTSINAGDEYKDREKMNANMDLWEVIEETDEEVGKLKLFVSYLIDEQGNATETIFSDDIKEEYPTFYPKGWSTELVNKHNLPVYMLKESLKLNQINNNWKIVTDIFIDRMNKGIKIDKPIDVRSKDAQEIQSPPPTNLKLEQVTNINPEKSISIQVPQIESLYDAGDVDRSKSPTFQEFLNAQKESPVVNRDQQSSPLPSFGYNIENASPGPDLNIQEQTQSQTQSQSSNENTGEDGEDGVKKIIKLN